MGPDEPDDPSASVFDRPAPAPPPRRREAFPPEPEPTRAQPPGPERTMTYPAGNGWAEPATTRPQPQGHPPPAPPGYPPPGYPPSPPTPRYPPPTRPRDRGTPPRGYDPREREPDPSRRGRVRESAPPRERTGGGLGFPFGLGALVGLLGLAGFLASLLVLPWFEAAGQEVTFADIRTAYEVPATDPDDLLPDDGDAGSQPPPTGDGQVPDAGEVAEAVEDVARDAAAEAAAGVIDTGKTRYLELYAERLWLAAAVGVALAVLFSTVLAPKSTLVGLILGFRRLSGVVVVLAAIAHGVAVWIVFSGDGGPSPAFGVWAGVGGLALVLLGCILGPKRS